MFKVDFNCGMMMDKWFEEQFGVKSKCCIYQIFGNILATKLITLKG